MNVLNPPGLKIPLISRLGRVGSIQRYPLWDSRRSIELAKRRIATIAALSYGRDEAQNPEGLFNRILREQHLSCFEFVPWLGNNTGDALPGASMRHHLSGFSDPSLWGEHSVLNGLRLRPGAIFLVECPIFVARQWMRHRSFSYLEVSRRYTPPGRLSFHFYGKDDPATLRKRAPFWDHVRDEFESRVRDGEPLELARGCLPVETMTKFWVGGFTDNWLARDEVEHEDGTVEKIPGFVGLRSDGHAQAEIRVFSDWIRDSFDRHLEFQP